MSSSTKLALLMLQGAQVVFLLLHDWVPLGRLSNLAAVRASDLTARLLLTTVSSALPFVAPFGLCCWFGLAPWPMWLMTWLLYTYGIALALIVRAWWVPYLRSADGERAERYRVRFANTLSFLPKRHGFAPDTLHVIYHFCVVTTFVLLILK